jgi:hypothetical protein
VGLAYKPVAPACTKAGVLGMARTMAHTTTQPAVNTGNRNPCGNRNNQGFFVEPLTAKGFKTSHITCGLTAKTKHRHAQPHRHYLR